MLIKNYFKLTRFVFDVRQKFETISREQKSFLNSLDTISREQKSFLNSLDKQ